MANQAPSATQSLTKNPPRRGKSDGGSSATLTREATPKNQVKAHRVAASEPQIGGAESSPAPEKRTTKQDQLAALLLRDKGATIRQMTDVTGWLPHTVRAALTGLKKKGYAIDSDKVGEVRTYRATCSQ